jgi:hypothetical protein
VSPARSAHSSDSAVGGRGLVTGLLVVAVAVIMVLITRSKPSVQPFDPRSSRPDGATALVLLLEKYAGSVTISTQIPSSVVSQRVLVLADRLGGDQRRALLQFAKDGGVVIVADPSSDLHGGDIAQATQISTDTQLTSFGTFSAELESNILLGDCSVPALQALRGVFAASGYLFAVKDGAEQCFTDPNDISATGSFVIVRSVGTGFIVGLGGNRPFTNQYLRYGDNSALAVALLAPSPTTNVSVVLGTTDRPTPSDVGTGSESLVDLVRPGVWMALLEIAIAFVIFAFARAIRPAKYLREPVVTQIAGNELVVATGNLMQRAQHGERAGWLLRSETYHHLCAEYSAPPDIQIERLAELVWRRTSIEPAIIVELLNRVTTTEAALSQLSGQLHDLRQSAGSQPETVLEHQ